MGREVAYLLFALLFFTSCYDSNFGDATLSAETPTQNCSIETLHKLYSSGTRNIKDAMIIVGHVTTNDKNGNFFKTFSIENNGYALEVMDGLFDSYTRYPLGAKVQLSLKGLRLDRYKGVLRVGLPAPDYDIYSIDYMGAEPIIDKYVKVYGDKKTIEPTSFKIEDLKEEMCGRMIEISDLKYISEDGIESTWSGYKLFTNRQNDSIWSYSSEYSSFAREIIPQGEISIVGMLQFGNTDRETDQFIIKPRDV